MTRIGPIASGFALALLATVSFNGIAAAQQTSLEQAWHKCLQAVDQATPRTGDGNNDQTRTAQFKACMEKLGVRP
jgi:hypothetical protein